MKNVAERNKMHACTVISTLQFTVFSYDGKTRQKPKHKQNLLHIQHKAV